MGNNPHVTPSHTAMTADSTVGAWSFILAPIENSIVRFDLVKIEEFESAFTIAMDLKRTEIEAITGQSAAPDFENTIAACEDSGRALGRAMSLFNTYTSSLATPDVQAIESKMGPILDKFGLEEIQNDKLFERIKAVYDARQTSGLTAEQQRLIKVYYDNFTRKGAGLDAVQKARLSEITERLSSLFTSFHHNQVADEKKYIVFERAADLAGLTPKLLADAAEEAKNRGLEGKWVISNKRSSIEPFLAFATRRDLREKAWRFWTSRGDNNDENDNKQNIREILKLRTERAQILGFKTHAHWVLDNNMAKTPAAAQSLMMKVWLAAVARVHEEVADMQAIADQDKITIKPWDYAYYSELVRKKKYDFDENAVKPYLQLEKIKEGMFMAAKRVHGIDMVKLEGLPVIHPDVTFYEVRRGGERLGLWSFDPYARDGKSSGAWMDNFVTQEKFRGRVLPVVTNCLNLVKGAAGEPTLLSWDEATTLFHEFGHAMHGLLSDVTYPTLAGTSVSRDFVELPSQVFERWFSTNEVLSQFAVHYQTGLPIPEALVAKLRQAKNFNQGFGTAEYLISAIYDMEIHLAATPDQEIDPNEFERQIMAKFGCPEEIVMRHRPGHFGHIFSGDGYSAGYYSYIWADTMGADGGEAFEEAGSFYDPATCERLSRKIYSVGNSVPAEVAFFDFRGRFVIDTDALMRDRGFPVV